MLGRDVVRDYRVVNHDRVRPPPVWSIWAPRRDGVSVRDQPGLGRERREDRDRLCRGRNLSRGFSGRPPR